MSAVPPQPGSEAERSARRVALIVAPLSSFINPFMGASINVALKAMESDLALDAVELGWVQTAFLVASAAVLVPLGRLSDIHGRRRVFILGIGLFTAASALAGLAADAALFMIARVVQGIGSAMMVANAVSILASLFPPAQRGRVIGINTAAVYAGLALGPVLGGLLTHHLSWRGIFLAAVPLGLLALALTWRALRGEWADARHERFDWLGAALYGLSLPALMAGLASLAAPFGVPLAIGGGLGLGLFAWRSWARPHPLYPVAALVRNRMFGLSNLVGLLTYSSSYGIPFLLSLYLQHIGRLDAASAGLVLLAQPAVMAVITPLAGRLADRFEPRWLVSIGLLLHAGGLAALAGVDADTPVAAIVAVLALVGCGLGVFSAPNISAIVGAVERSRYGVAAASAGSVRLVGQSFSMGAVTLIAALAIGRIQVAAAGRDALLETMHLAFGAFAAVAGGALIASLLRGRRR